LLNAQGAPTIDIYATDSEIIDLQYCGNTFYDPEQEGAENELDRYTLIQTKKGTILVSRDDGQSFKELTSAFNEALKAVNGSKEDDHSIIKMHTSKFNPSHLFFLGMTDISFYSPDCGKTISAFRHDLTITNFEVAANSEKLLGFSLILCDEGNSCP